MRILSFSQFCDIIILISALCIAITNIYNFFAKPTSKLKKKKTEELNNQISDILDEKLPEILLEHDLETRQKYLDDKQNCLNEIKTAVLTDVKDTLDSIYKLNLEQNESIKTLSQGNKDMLRQRIMDIYYTYREEKRLPIHKKEALDELYKDYKAEGGNSYIDKYHNRMKLWEIYDDENYED